MQTKPRDFTQTSTEQLRRSYRFHVNDRGTMTMGEELRRMQLIDGIGDELRDRGINPDQAAA